MKKLTLLLIIGTMFSAMFCYGQKVPTVKITLRVEDPEGVPIAGAEAGMAGDMNTPENGPIPRRGKGKTDSEGRFTAEIATGLGNVAVRATKEGFYAGDERSVTTRLFLQPSKSICLTSLPMTVSPLMRRKKLDT